MNAKTKVASAVAEGPKTVAQIVSETGLHRQTVCVALWELQEAGSVSKSRAAGKKYLVWQSVQAQEAA